MRIGWLIKLLLGWVWIGSWVAEAAGNEVLVIYNAQMPASEAVARHYAQRRSVPDSQLLGLRLSDSGTISRADYVSGIQEPVRSISLKTAWRSGCLIPVRRCPVARRRPGIAYG